MKFSTFDIAVNGRNERTPEEIVVEAVIIATTPDGEELTFETLPCLFNPSARDPFENELVPSADYESNASRGDLEAAQKLFEAWIERGAPINEDAAPVNLEIDGTTVSIEDCMI